MQKLHRPEIREKSHVLRKVLVKSGIFVFLLIPNQQESSITHCLKHAYLQFTKKKKKKVYCNLSWFSRIINREIFSNNKYPQTKTSCAVRELKPHQSLKGIIKIPILNLRHYNSILPKAENLYSDIILRRDNYQWRKIYVKTIDSIDLKYVPRDFLACQLGSSGLVTGEG